MADSKIKMITRQTIDGQTHSFTTEAIGFYEKTNGIFTVKYLPEGSDIYTVITIKRDFALVERGGDNLTVEAGKIHHYEFSSQFGVISLDVKGVLVEAREANDTLTLKMKYRLFQSGDEISQNEITLTAYAVGR